MADRGLFFRAIARVSPRYQSPSVAIWLATALGVVYVLLNDFQQLADKFILGIWPFYALAVAAVFVLRRTRPELRAAVPDLGLSGGAAAVPARVARDGGERAGDRPGEHGGHLRDHPGGGAGVLRVAWAERWAGGSGAERGGVTVKRTSVDPWTSRSRSSLRSVTCYRSRDLQPDIRRHHAVRQCPDRDEVRPRLRVARARSPA